MFTKMQFELDYKSAAIRHSFSIHPINDYTFGSALDDTLRDELADAFVEGAEYLLDLLNKELDKNGRG